MLTSARSVTWENEHDIYVGSEENAAVYPFIRSSTVVYARVRIVDRYLKQLKIRIVVSILLFAAFAVTGVVMAAQGTIERTPTPLVVLLLLAYFSMPRQTLPRRDVGRERAAAEELEHDAADRALAGRLQALRLRLTYVRMGYFLVAIVIFVGLPALF